MVKHRIFFPNCHNIKQKIILRYGSFTFFAKKESKFRENLIKKSMHTLETM